MLIGNDKAVVEKRGLSSPFLLLGFGTTGSVYLGWQALVNDFLGPPKGSRSTGKHWSFKTMNVVFLPLDSWENLSFFKVITHLIQDTFCRKNSIFSKWKISIKKAKDSLGTFVLICSKKRWVSVMVPSRLSQNYPRNAFSLLYHRIGPRDWKSSSRPVIIIRLKSRKLRNDEKFTSANHEAREHASSKQPWNSRIPPLKNWKIWLTWNSNETRRKGGTKSDRSQNYDLSSCLGFTKNIAWVHWEGPKGVEDPT